MKRKIILHGPSTFTISLPSSWVKNQNLKKGDELEVEEFGNDLRISKNSIINYYKKEIFIGNLRRVGKSSITSAYRAGFDEITIHYKDPHYIKEINKIVQDELLGFSIVIEDKNSCIIKDLAGNEKNEYGSAFNRLIYLVIDISNESLIAIKSKDSLKLKEISYMDKQINKLSNYCLRILTKKGDKDYKRTPKLYSLVKSLEEIADKYKDLCNYFSENRERISPQLKDNLTALNYQLLIYVNLYKKFDDSQLEMLFLESKELLNKIILNKNGLQPLSSILINIRNSLPILIELNL